MSRDMLKPLQNDTGHPKKTIPQNDTSQTCKTIRGTLNDFHHYHRQVILTPAHVLLATGLKVVTQVSLAMCKCGYPTYANACSGP